MLGLVSVKVVALAVWAAALALVERWRPAAPRPAGASRLARNLGLWLCNTVMNPVLTLPIVVFASQVDLWSRPVLTPGLGLALDILVLDLWAYAWHRANHEWRWFWRFHQVHHRDTFLDVTTSVRFHPGEVLISAVARAPLIIALDIPLASLLVFDALLTAAALFHHSNARLPARPEAALRAIIVTPSHHWVHHHARRVDTDSNYGVLFTLWDRLLGTWSPTARTPDMTIGVEGEHDLTLPGLAVLPLRNAPERA